MKLDPARAITDRVQRSDPPWTGRFPRTDDRLDPCQRFRDCRDESRIRVLVAMPTSNQMYSGIGRAIKELCCRLDDRIDFTFALDDRDPRTLRRVWELTSRLRGSLCIGAHRMEPDWIDPSNVDLPALVARGDWDLIELIGFANAATGRDVLEHISDRTALCYTPHDQPLSTIMMTAEEAANVATIHRRVLNRADLVLADSPAERLALQRICPQRLNVRELPLGCDFGSFKPGRIDRPPQLLFVGDLAEPRKRFDRVIEVFADLHQQHPEYQLLVIGNRSDAAADQFPESVRSAVKLRGYVTEAELSDAYATSRALFLLSEVEAFGLPILEAMASGTPVVLSDLETTRSLFQDCRAAHFVPGDRPEEIRGIVGRLLEHWSDSVRAAIDDLPNLQARFDWNQLADRKSEAMRAAWYRRNSWSWSA